MSALEDSILSNSRCDNHLISDAKRMEITVPWVPKGDDKESQLALNVGDIVWVLETSDSGWCGGHKDGDDNTGWFPDVICKILPRGDCDESAEHSALFTSDHRAVASPQARPNMRCAAQLAELAEVITKLEHALEAGKKNSSSLEADLKTANRSAEFDSQEWLKERQMWAKKVEEVELKASWDVHAAHEECSRNEAELQERRRSAQVFEAELTEQKDRFQALEGQLLKSQDQIRLLQAQASMGRGTQMEDSKEDLAARGTSRRLFATDGNRTDGNRTPTPPVTAMQTVPNLPVQPASSTSMYSSLSAVSRIPLSARQQPPVGNSLSRPSPRGGPVSTAPTLSWMSSSSTAGLPPSPHMRQRVFSHSEMALQPEAIPQAPVRTLVSEFERRSNSQGPSLSREPPINRQLVFAQSSTNVAPSSASASSGIRRAIVMTGSSRAPSREAMPMRSASAMPASETPHASPTHGREEPKNTFTYGMSPINRSHGYTTTTIRPGVANGVAGVSMSPSSRGTMSVQDRIRQLNGGQLWR
mmetsp:Transcript_60231/g.108434  ORF Transcript_60231/g.108434 Transcript_60231/m.108434 type:complete len:530 (+) Transcript_60231:105-1694(+)